VTTSAVSRPRGFVAFLVLASALFVGSLWGSTQYTAARFGFSRRLGPPLLVVARTPLYAPWAWLAWAERFERAAPEPFAVAQGITFGGAIAAFLILMGAAGGLRRQATSTAHGSARWATDRELRRGGLLEPRGVVLCQTQRARYASTTDPKGTRWTMKRSGRLIRHDGPEHVFVFAPTRSGKGIGIVIPTLLTWSRSVLIYDIKKELWAATAGWRRRFSHCWRFEPTAEDSIRFNPLSEIRRGLSEVRDAQNVADILVDPQGTSERRDHWQQTAHTLLVGAILHVLYAERDKSLAGVAAFLANPAATQAMVLHRMLGTRHTGAGPHPVVAQTAREMMNKSENELSGVFSTAMTCLALYADPVIARNTSRSDFRIADLMNLESPVSLYLVVPPSDIDRTRPLVRLMLNQIGRRLTERMEFQGTAYRHRLLMLLDEFPSLGRLAFFEGELPYLAGYGIKCFLIAQSLNQIEKAYGANNAILDNCHIRVTYNALDERTARRISDLLGQATLIRRQRSFAGGQSWLSKVSHSEQEVGRALLMPDEILRLPYDEALLMVGGLPPYHAKKIMYYLDARFRDRAWLKPPESARARAAELPHGQRADEWPEPPEMPEPEDLPAANDEASTVAPVTSVQPEIALASTPGAAAGPAAAAEIPTGAVDAPPDPIGTAPAPGPPPVSAGQSPFMKIWEGTLRAKDAPPRTADPNDRSEKRPHAPIGGGHTDNSDKPGDI
jgi:type IV secretion system protein VirD4